MGNQTTKEEQEEQEPQHSQSQLQLRCDLFRRNLESQVLLLDGELFCREFNAFVGENPEVLEYEDEHGDTLRKSLFFYIYNALRKKYPLASYRALVEHTSSVLRETCDDGYTLMHWACRFNNNNTNDDDRDEGGSLADIVALFLRLHPGAAGDLTSSLKFAPLHVACNEGAPLPVIRLLFEAYPAAVYLCDKRIANTPLHRACRNKRLSLDVIEYLTTQRPGICLLQNDDGDLPLDVAKSGAAASGAAAAANYSNDDDVIESLTRSTKTSAGVLAARLYFQGPVPREIFEQVAAYLDDGPSGEVDTVKQAFSRDEIIVLLRRTDIRDELRERTTRS